MTRRSGEAMSALARRAPTMRHRCAGRGGTRNEHADILAEMQDADGLDEDEIRFELPRRGR